MERVGLERDTARSLGPGCVEEISQLGPASGWPGAQLACDSFRLRAKRDLRRAAAFWW